MAARTKKVEKFTIFLPFDKLSHKLLGGGLHISTVGEVFHTNFPFHNQTFLKILAPFDNSLHTMPDIHDYL
jgi:hypothetical protein